MHVDVGYKKRNVKCNIVIPRGDKKKTKKPIKLKGKLTKKTGP
jgi:hypothetical protein